MSERYAFFIGRFQPLHEGHKRLIQVALDEGKPVLVGLMDTEISASNPYTVIERMAMFWDAFGDKVQTMCVPPIGEVCYGRNVDYRIRRIHLPADIERISATAIREGE